MKKFSLLLVLFVVTAFSCKPIHTAHYQFNQKFSAPAVKTDMALLKKILEANHPSLYWYTPKDSIDAIFSNTISSITDSLTEIQCRNKIANIISTIACGHTSVRFSKDYAKASIKHRYPQFPLHIKTWGNDSMVVLENMWIKDSILKRGTIITSINGKSNKEILETMFRLISTDGYSNGYKSQVFSNNFPGWYKLALGLDSVYNIGYIDTLGKEKIVQIKNFAPIKDSTHSVKIQPTKSDNLLAKRSITIDTVTHTAFLKVATFSNGHLRKFFHRSFKTIQQKKVQNLVVDLRENTGGKLALSTLFTKYISSHPFKTGDSVFSIRKKLRFAKHIRQSEEFFWSSLFTAKKGADGFYHYKRAEKHWYVPKKNYHFNGQVFILQSGLTFSAATLVISVLNNQSNVTTVGEETGGGQYGNSAMHLPTVVLPNTKLQISLPTYRLVIDSTRTKNGRGFFPTIYVPPSTQNIKHGIDGKMLVIRQLIQARNSDTTKGSLLMKK